MNFLKKKETPVENIAFIGILSSINVIFVLLSSLLPILFLLLVFILPLTSMIITIYCKKKYYPIYFLTSMGLCIAVTAGFSIFDSFIYVFPSLITGFVFGILIEKHVNALYIIQINTIIQFVVTYLTFIFIEKCITNINFFNSLYTLFGLIDFQFKGVLTNIFTYIVAQIQILVTYVFIKYEAKRLNLEINLELNNRVILYALYLIDLIMTIFSIIFFKDYALLLTLLILPSIIYLLFNLFSKKNKIIYLSLLAAFTVFVFLFAFSYQKMPAGTPLTLIHIFFVLVTIIDCIFNYCFKEKTNTIK